MSAKSEQLPAVAFKDNFWSNKRVEAGIKIKDVASYTGTSVGLAGAWFTGQFMPSEENIAKLCKFFDVELLKGTQEFIKAHKEWDAVHKRGKAKMKQEMPKPESKSKEVKPKEVKQGEKVEMSSVEKVDKILELVYGKVSRADYEKRRANIDNALEIIYSKVDYAVYNTVEGIIKDKIVKVENFSKWEI